MNRVSRLFLFAILFSINSFGQQMGIPSYRPDTLSIAFGSHFEYDVVFIELNGIEISRDLVYTQRSTENSHLKREFLISNQLEVDLKVMLYRRHRSFNLEFSPLWWKWDEELDHTVYEDPIVKFEKIQIRPGKTSFVLYYKSPNGRAKAQLYLEKL